MIVMSRVWSAELGQFITVQNEMNVKMKSAVSTYNDLLSVSKAVGDVRITMDTKQLYVCDGNTWLSQGHINLDDIMLDISVQEIS